MGKNGAEDKEGGGGSPMNRNRAAQKGKNGLKAPLLEGDQGNDAGLVSDDADDGGAQNGVQMRETRRVSFHGQQIVPQRRRSEADMPKEIESGPIHVALLNAIENTAKKPGSLRKIGDGEGVEAVPTMRGDEVANSLRELGFKSLLQLIPSDPDKVGSFAISEATASERHPLTHHRLLGFLRYEVDLFRFGITVHDRCAILLPNGPELAVCLLMCVSRCTCVPINHQQTPSEVRALLLGTDAKALIVLHDEEDERVQEVVEGLAIEVIALKPSNSFQGLFSLSPHHLTSESDEELNSARGFSRAAAKLVSKSLPARPSAVPSTEEEEGGVLDVGLEQKEGKGSRRRWREGEGAIKGVGFMSRARRQLQLNGPKDPALILHTSGTSAACKRVPYTLENLCVGASCIAASWKLSKLDVCFNMMPLFHVGGISRNILAPILVGGGVVCAPMLDPALFWEALLLRGVTWYYAGPTMHQMILEEMSNHAQALNAKRGLRRTQLLRFVANASGGLSEALAERMHAGFGCCVLPCYGMTECMPVSSPPLVHPVLHPASSGQVVGPYVRVMGGDGEWLGPKQIGEVVLKGAPVIDGYIGDGAEASNKRGFTEEGWFRTGDMGFVQDGGWLTLTGRCKEVINRGGELISPLEVEEVVVRHPLVREVMAFSCPHEVLQEVVAVAIVSIPNSDSASESVEGRRVDLSNLQRFVSESLHPSKWPQLIVYLDKLPKNTTMKLQRIGVAERMALAPLSDGEGQAMRLFEGEGPEPGAPMKDKIAVRRVVIDVDEVTKAVSTVSRRTGLTESAAITCPMPGEKGGVGVLLYVSPASLDPFMLKESLKPLLHDYLVPLHIIALDTIPADPALLPAPPKGREMSGTGFEPRTETERQMQLLWGELLGKEVEIEADFFHCGGNSLLAGRLVAQVRSMFGVPMTAATLFKHRSIASMSELTDQLLETHGGSQDERSSIGKGISGSYLSLYGRERGYFAWWEMKEAEGKTTSQRSGAAMVVQLLPLTVLYPLRRVVTWTSFISLWLYLLAQVGMNRLAALIVALAAARVVAECAFPVVFLICKWLIIGRYRAGRYPLWGQYYLRWWFLEKLQQLCGRGVFRHTNWSLCLYYRMLGAKIGNGVKIDPRAVVSEFDLIHIGTETAIDNVRVSAFFVDQYAMVLEPLEVGEQCSIPCKVSLVPGIVVPPHTAFGPLSSSYEIGDGSTTGGEAPLFDGNARYCRQRFPEPVWYLKLLGFLVMLIVWLVEQIPVLILLRLIVIFPWYMKEIKTYVDVLRWFLTPERIGYYVALRVLRTTALPLIRVAMCIVVKRVLIGKFTEGLRCRSQWYIFKHWLMAKLLPGEKLQEAAHLVGAHYEGVSWMLRGLGAKCGKRIYWPGTCLQGLVEYDLLEVGDDVVFGSRTNVIICDAVSSKTIRISAGANVGDRCVLLPGCTLGKNSLLGSGGLGGRGMILGANSKWVGSQGGAAVMLDAGPGGEPTVEGNGDEETLRPFGKAMYKGLAPYIVLPGWFHGLFTALCRSIAASWRALTLIAAFEITRLWLRGGGTFISQPVTLWGIAERITPLFFVAHNAATLLALFLAWWSKWALIGRRRPGEFDWDKSSYCQRWQLYLSLTGIIRSAYFGEGVLDLLHGSVYMVWWFRSLGAQIGREVCLYPRGADPMMTEPDLVQIGSFACVDSASIIAHINSRGSFALNAISVSPGANLRADSRLLSGAAMMPGSTLLEHTLVLGGDVVDEGATWQGWPGQAVLPQTPSVTPKMLTPSTSRDRLDALGRL